MQIKFLIVLLLVGICNTKTTTKIYWPAWYTTSEWNDMIKLCKPAIVLGDIRNIQNRTITLHNTASKYYSDYFYEHVNALYYPGKAQQVLDELRAKGAERNEEIRQKAEEIGADIILACLTGIDEHFKDEYEKIRQEMDNCATDAIKVANETFKALVLNDDEVREAKWTTFFLIDCLTDFDYKRFWSCMNLLMGNLSQFLGHHHERIKEKIDHIPVILNKLDNKMEDCLSGTKVKKLINDDVAEVAECAAIESGKNVFEQFMGEVFNLF